MFFRNDDTANMIDIQFNKRLGFQGRLDFINLYNDSLQDKTS
jgi:hypothetical protein